MRDAPQFYARIGGVLYLLIIAAALFAEFVRERFIVPANAAATAGDITDHAFMFRLGTAQLLSPRLASMLFLSILVPAFIGELSFAVWLTVKGVNLARWREITERSGSALL